MLHAYAAFLRGIMPHGKNMSNAQLREVFASLGLQQVASVISSGNIVFCSPSNDVTRLEYEIATALQQQLGIKGLTMLRSQEQLATILASNVFGGFTHERKTYLTVTLFKDAPVFTLDNLPEQPSGSKVLAINTSLKVLYAVTDVTTDSTIDLMTWLERYFGKDQTTRTWPTLQKVQTKLPV